MFFGCGMLILASLAVSPNILAIMGGLHSDSVQTPSQELVRGLPCFAILSCLLWFILMAANSRLDDGWGVARDPGARCRSDLKALAILSLLVWLPILLLTQPEQQRRYQVEKALREMRVADAVELLATHPREVFPPHWAPPPSSMSVINFTWQGDRWRRDRELVLAVLEESTRTELPDWIHDLYLRRISWVLKKSSFAESEYVERLVEVLPRVRGGLAVLKEVETNPRFPDHVRDRLKEIRSKIPRKSDKKAP
jgi:hypothetical protein